MSEPHPAPATTRESAAAPSHPVRSAHSHVTVHGPPERVADFVRVFGSATVPVKQLVPRPVRASLPGLGVRDVYDLDLAAITPEQRERLVDHASERFRVDRAEVERDLERLGFPIVAEGCTFQTTASALP